MSTIFPDKSLFCLVSEPLLKKRLVSEDGALTFTGLDISFQSLLSPHESPIQSFEVIQKSREFVHVTDEVLVYDEA